MSFCNVVVGGGGERVEGGEAFVWVVARGGGEAAGAARGR